MIDLLRGRRRDRILRRHFKSQACRKRFQLATICRRKVAEADEQINYVRLRDDLVFNAWTESLEFVSRSS